MSFNGDIDGVNITGTNTETAGTTLDFPLTTTGIEEMQFTTDTNTAWTEPWQVKTPTPTKEFLEMWKWLRAKLLKELLSDEPKGIKIVNITQLHKPNELPQYKVEIEFIPVEMKSNLREIDKPSVQNRSPTRPFGN